jgi:hypothetical protein
MRYRYPQPLKVVRFLENSLSFNHLNISRADIPCVLENGVVEAARLTQPVTLYITVYITPPTLYNSPPPSIPTADGSSPAEEAPISGRIQPPSPEHPLSLSHHQPVKAANNKPQRREEVSPASANDLRPALAQADQAMKRMDRLNTWQDAVGRVKWVMDTLGPIAEVRVIPLMSLAKLTTSSIYSISHPQRWHRGTQSHAAQLGAGFHWE